MYAVTTRRNGSTAGVEAGGVEWQEALPVWLGYLIAAFPQARVGMMTYAVLEDVFQGYAPEVMKAAARAYVARHQFWPTAAELRPFVEWAEREAVEPPTGEELHRLRMAQVRARIQYSDEEMLAWEIERGTIVVEEVGASRELRVASEEAHDAEESEL